MNEPRITVILPTRERCDVLEKSLQTLVTQQYRCLQILVSDNNSSDDTAGVVSRLRDSRIRYINTGKRVSMSHNWEFALSHVDDGWVTFIGDDDGLPPGAIQRVADIIRETGSMAIRSGFSTYEWPALTGKDHGYLLTPMGSDLRIRQSAPWLAKVMRGHAKYTELPMLYNGGFIHVSVLRGIRDRTGSYFRSSIPDVYSAVAIASVVESYVYTEEPLAISGTSRHSTGNSVFSKSTNRNTTPGAKFAAEQNIPFHPAMPLCADNNHPLSLHALVYEAYLQSAALRKDGATQADHMQQLEIIMGGAGVHSPSVREWGKRFAELHGLDYRKALRGARIRELFLRPHALLKKVMNAANCISAGSDETPIRDIYEASIAASVIRAKPGRTRTLYGILRKQLRKPSGQQALV